MILLLGYQICVNLIIWPQLRPTKYIYSQEYFQIIRNAKYKQSYKCRMKYFSVQFKDGNGQQSA